MNWQPYASIETLKQKAKLLKIIRDFFESKKIYEVETPALAPHAVTDAYLDNIKANLSHHSLKQAYLQTSPEYFMKRLLAAGSGDIYQITKAFRDEESGAFHNPEFSMLEWYRIDFNHHDLMDEVAQLLQLVLKTKKANKVSYQSLFLNHLNICPFESSLEDMANVLKAHNIELGSDLNSRDEWLFLLLSHLIEPKLGFDAPVIIYDFPVSQANLAKLNDAKDRACRFEVYVKGIELANGFWELTDALEQQSRFKKDNELRLLLGKTSVNVDKPFLAALKSGLPNCAGVALGLDRLFMLALGQKNIQSVMAFPM